MNNKKPPVPDSRHIMKSLMTEGVVTSRMAFDGLTTETRGAQTQPRAQTGLMSQPATQPKVSFKSPPAPAFGARPKK